MPSSLRLTSLAALLAGAAMACTHPATTAAPAPAPASIPIPATSFTEAPHNWHLMDLEKDGVPGISATRAMQELLSNMTPKRTVLVAVIDGGIDTAHVDLRANLWQNPRDSANGRDDDGNGYTDDTWGWNFIGGHDGQDVHWDTFELTRLHALCTGKPAAAGMPPITPAIQARCPALARSVDSARTDAQRQLQQYTPYAEAATNALKVLKAALHSDTLSRAMVESLQSDDPEVQRARRVYLQLLGLGASPQELIDYVQSLDAQVKYNLNADFNPRTIVGDTYANTAERRYGNRDVMGPDAEHGTHVGGIIGAVRDNGVGMDGIAPSVRVMMVRTVPDGDERDKDVANAIRYAADMGAQVINMSFGKAYSPFKATVDSAVQYAISKGVLLVHAAGNEGADLSKADNFPNPFYASGGRATNWIEVGASNWRGGEQIAASFSNWGRGQVDVFAPGVDIYSTVPGSKYERNSGTSMASPVVAGAAALLMAYFPNLTAADVKRILIASATPHGELMTVRPGSDNDRVRFSTLSSSGGIINVYNAVKMAQSESH